MDYSKTAIEELVVAYPTVRDNDVVVFVLRLGLQFYLTIHEDIP